MIVENVIEHYVELFFVQGRDLDAFDLAIDAYHRRFSGADMQVRGSLFVHEEQEFRYVHSSAPPQRENNFIKLKKEGIVKWIDNPFEDFINQYIGKREKKIEKRNQCVRMEPK
jgi:hypothetical protein